MPRASRKKLDCIFALSKWILVLVCLLSLTPRGIIAQNESNTFESAFGLNEPEANENQNIKENVGSPLQMREVEDLAAEEEEDLAPVEKEDENPVQVMPDAESTFEEKSESGMDTTIQKIPGKMANEKTGKYEYVSYCK